MYEKITALMQWRSDLLISGRLEELSREFLFPLAIYQADRQLVLEAPADLIALHARLRAAQSTSGVEGMIAQVNAVDLPRNGRFRVWVRYYDVDPQGRRMSQTDAVLYFRETPEGLKTEMVEYGLCRIPEIWQDGHLAQTREA